MNEQSRKPQPPLTVLESLEQSRLDLVTPGGVSDFAEFLAAMRARIAKRVNEIERAGKHDAR